MHLDTFPPTRLLSGIPNVVFLRYFKLWIMLDQIIWGCKDIEIRKFENYFPQFSEKKLFNQRFSRGGIIFQENIHPQQNWSMVMTDFITSPLTLFNSSKSWMNLLKIESTNVFNSNNSSWGIESLLLTQIF